MVSLGRGLRARRRSVSCPIEFILQFPQALYDFPFPPVCLSPRIPSPYGVSHVVSQGVIPWYPWYFTHKWGRHDSSGAPDIAVVVLGGLRGIPWDTPYIYIYIYIYIFIYKLLIHRPGQPINNPETTRARKELRVIPNCPRCLATTGFYSAPARPRHWGPHAGP